METYDEFISLLAMKLAGTGTVIVSKKYLQKIKAEQCAQNSLSRKQLDEARKCAKRSGDPLLKIKYLFQRLYSENYGSNFTYSFQCAPFGIIGKPHLNPVFVYNTNNVERIDIAKDIDGD